ncbi:amino acid ABC transporter permease [uncultured Thalassospira sp.]|jgi:polar amino acid transport system permease protein|uniref:amino acid ABC transporter permease n=1 Tax=uncultured Thalassospira sp. TaxID=404382 RepID=UPI0030D7F0A0|tara:strand:- start:7155 stop:7823 length:669 start_codon:yes stop_codon:yes gene_type:complete
MNILDWGYIIDALPDLMRGLGMTLMVSGLAICFSLLIGIAGCILRVSPLKILAYPVIAYVEFIRGTPYLVQVFFVFYGLPSLGLKLSIFWSGVVALTIWASVFHIESFRAGLSSVSKDMRDASASLGLGQIHHVLMVVFPIAARVALPSMLNTIVATIKNSAYLQAIGLVELTFVAVDRIAYEFRSTEMFLAICVIYLVVVIAVSNLGQQLEKRLNRPYAER